MAAPVEDASGFDYQAGRVDFARNDTLWLNLDATFCKNHTIETASNHHAVPFNLTFYLCILSEDHGLFGDNVSLHLPIDSKRACDGERSFQRYPLVNESGPFF